MHLGSDDCFSINIQDVAFCPNIVPCHCLLSSFIPILLFLFLQPNVGSIGLMRSLSFRTLNHQYDYTFDWTMLKQKAAQQGATSAGQGQQAQTPTGKQTDKPKPNMKG